MTVDGSTERAPIESPAPLLTVLMPVYNERSTIEEILRRVLEVPISKELLIIDDASTDGTREYLQQRIDGSDPALRAVYREQNGGKGAAIRAGLPYVRGRYVVIQDGDLEYDPMDFLKLVRVMDEEGAPIVYGSRFIHGIPPMRWANRLINRLLAMMVRRLYGAAITDEATCYKAFRSEVLLGIPLTCRRFEFCPEVTAKALRSGYDIRETPITYRARTVKEGKKIRWTDGVAAIWTLIRYRWWRPSH